MHGAAGALVAEILSGGAGPLRVAPFRAERDPLFGGVHPEPIGANLAAAAERVRAEGFDLAVAQDGDADRLGVLDAQGRFVSPHQVLALLLLHVFRSRGRDGRDRQDLLDLVPGRPHRAGARRAADRDRASASSTSPSS